MAALQKTIDDDSTDDQMNTDPPNADRNYWLDRDFIEDGDLCDTIIGVKENIRCCCIYYQKPVAELPEGIYPTVRACWPDSLHVAGFIDPKTISAQRPNGTVWAPCIRGDQCPLPHNVKHLSPEALQ